MLHIGLVSVSKSQKQKVCKYCEHSIPKGETQVRRSTRGKEITRNIGGENRKVPLFSYSYYHSVCFKRWYVEAEQKWEESPFKTRKPPEELEGKLKKLQFTPEQRRRRHTIQIYLSSKFRNQLIKAYNDHNTERVVQINNRMVDYLEELESFGPKIDFKWLDLDGVGCIGGNLELFQLVKTYDRPWQERLWSWRHDKETWTETFRRVGKFHYTPEWGDHV